MRNRLMTLIFLTIFFLLVDIYLFQAVLAVSKDWTPVWKAVARYGFWVPTVICLGILTWWAVADPYRMGSNTRNIMITVLFATYFSKIFGILFVFVDDLQRGVRWVASLFTNSGADKLPGEAITRSEFLTKAALVATAVPFGAMAYGV